MRFWRPRRGKVEVLAAAIVEAPLGEFDARERAAPLAPDGTEAAYVDELADPAPADMVGKRLTPRDIRALLERMDKKPAAASV